MSVISFTQRTITNLTNRGGASRRAVMNPEDSLSLPSDEDASTAALSSVAASSWVVSSVFSSDAMNSGARDCRVCSAGESLRRPIPANSAESADRGTALSVGAATRRGRLTAEAPKASDTPTMATSVAAAARRATVARGIIWRILDGFLMLPNPAFLARKFSPRPKLDCSWLGPASSIRLAPLGRATWGPVG
eukprot:CAMPEP_0113544554 /NCGR_PEP_ID=MMETSP0015_2-20120614/10775_1 /TAXON_ID=2838 /ORGANISM="Odontella" /LENGTH=191 /DNA_ID=CAMNT_0000444831 /DNA_START=497 /DNA_END=1072 /DNA_ORIENTATION=- /assembly_acc=CAM_ASM_000160